MDVASTEPMLPEEAGRGLDDGTFELIREASMLAGRVHPLVQDSMGAALLAKGLLVATTGSHKSTIRLGFPIDVVERWFPRLYPARLS